MEPNERLPLYSVFCVDKASLFLGNFDDVLGDSGFTPVLFSGDAVVPKKGKAHGLKIFQRFHFASALKRMSVIAGHTPPGSVDTEYIASVKGAPETLRSMVSFFISRLHLPKPTCLRLV